MPTEAQYCENKERYAQYYRTRYRKHRQKVLDESRRYRLANPEKVRRLRLLGRFGITIEQYDALLSKQDGVCAICSAKAGKRRLAVDHDHVTGKIRGLLCGKCNKALGLFSDRDDLLDRAKGYLNATR